MRQTIVCGLLIALLGPVTLLIPAARAQDPATLNFTTADGSFSFAYPADWAVFYDGGGTTIVATDSSALSQAASDFGPGDVRIQVMSPPAARSLIGLPAGTPAAAYRESFVSRLGESVTAASQSEFAAGAQTVYRADLQDANFDISFAAVEAAPGAVAVMFAFTARGERAAADAALTTVAASVTYTAPQIDAATLQPISVDNARGLAPLAHLGGHETWVRTVAFSPDGTRLASGDGEFNVRVWDVATGETVSTFAAPRPFSAGPVFSPDGSQLLFGGTAGEIWLWDIAAGEAVAEFEGLSGVVWTLAYSPDGTQIAAAGEDMTARVYDVASGDELMILVGHRDGITGVAFHPDGERLGTTSWDGTLRLWDIASGNEVLQINGPSTGLTTLDFHPDGAQVAAGARNGTVRVWDLDGAVVFVIQGDENLTGLPAVAAVRYSPDGGVLAVGTQDTLLTLWDADFGVPLTSLEGPGWMNDVAISADGRMLAAANDSGLVLLWGVPAQPAAPAE